MQIPPASGDDDQCSQCGRDRWTGALDVAGKRATPARSGPVEPHRIGSNRTADVLHLLLAGEVERQSELALQLVEGCAGNQDSPRLANLLQPRRNVDAVAEQVVALDHHVAEVDPDTVDEAFFRRGSLLAFRRALLHRDRERHSVDDRAELSDEAVAHRLDDPSAILGKKRIDGRGLKVLQSREGGTFVSLDLARIPHHVSGEDGGQPPHRTFHGPLPCERASPCGELHKPLLRRAALASEEQPKTADGGKLLVH